MNKILTAILKWLVVLLTFFAFGVTFKLLWSAFKFGWDLILMKY